jgi:hypothetical protein
MAERASDDELDSLAESCQKAMEAVAKSFTNCKQP